MSEENKTKQFVVNVNESDKEVIGNLKSELGVGDKGIITILLEVARNNRTGVLVEDGVSTEVDTFAVLAEKLGLVKTKKEKVVLTKEEKEKIRLEKKLAKLQAQLEAETAEPVPTEPETVVEIGV